MKFFSILIAAITVGCSSAPQYSPSAMTYEQVVQLHYDDVDCPRGNQILDQLDEQLRLKGYDKVNPEELTRTDRLYNSRVRAAKWGLIIGCNNPDRYARK